MAETIVPTGPFIVPTGPFNNREYIVLAPAVFNKHELRLYQFGDNYSNVMREGDYVYQRVGQVKRVEKEIEVDKLAPIVVGYEWTGVIAKFSVVAVCDGSAWVKAQPHDGSASYMTTMWIKDIPPRKAVEKTSVLEIVKE